MTIHNCARVSYGMFKLIIRRRRSQTEADKKFLAAFRKGTTNTGLHSGTTYHSFGLHHNRSSGSNKVACTANVFGHYGRQQYYIQNTAGVGMLLSQFCYLHPNIHSVCTTLSFRQNLIRGKPQDQSAQVRKMNPQMR